MIVENQVLDSSTWNMMPYLHHLEIDGILHLATGIIVRRASYHRTLYSTRPKKLSRIERSSKRAVAPTSDGIASLKISSPPQRDTAFNALLTRGSWLRGQGLTSNSRRSTMVNLWPWKVGISLPGGLDHCTLSALD